MTLSLTTSHAKALSELDALNNFDKLRGSLELLEDVEAMQKALRSRFRKVLKNLRSNGATFEEIARRTGLEMKELERLVTPGSRAMGEGALE